MSNTLFGIPNCDRVRAARRWLAAASVDFAFHDLRRDGLDRARLDDWIDRVGLEALVNRRGTTWRQLSESERDDRSRLIDAVLREPTLLKRPLLEHGGGLEVGFDPARYAELLPH